MKPQTRPVLILGAAIAGIMLLSGFSVDSLGNTEFFIIGGIAVLVTVLLAFALTRGKQRKTGGEPQKNAESIKKSLNDDSAANIVSKENQNSSAVAPGKFEIRNQFINQRFDPALGAAYAEFLGYLPYDDFLRILENSYKIVQFHRATKCLINIQQLPVHDPRASKYINEVWFSSVKSLGVRCIAFVLPASAMGQASTQKTHQSVETMDGLVVSNFSDEEEARKWLRSITN